MKWILAVPLLLLAITIVSISSSQPPETFGAVAVSDSTHSFGAGTGGSRDEAQKFSLAWCNKSDCEVRLWCKDCCFAVVSSDRHNGFWHWWLPATEQDRTRDIALDKCSQSGASDCRVVWHGCAMRWSY